MRSGHPAAFRHKPRLRERREGEINVVTAQQDMFADRNPPDVGDRARRAGSQLEQAEIRSAAADIDDQDVARLGPRGGSARVALTMTSATANRAAIAFNGVTASILALPIRSCPSARATNVPNM